MMFMSQRPYIPTRSLRGVLAYPSTQVAFKESDFIAALDRVGLKHLTSALDKNARWDRELSPNDQQSLAFARLFLHKPRWVFLDEAFDSLTPGACKLVFDIFKHELVQTAVVNIGRPATQNGFFTRVLHLVPLPEGERLAPCFDPSHLIRAAKPRASAIKQTLVS
jgi:putative ATP-binding cassette transporter